MVTLGAAGETLPAAFLEAAGLSPAQIKGLLRETAAARL
jgi:hypothetical protein